MVQIQCVYCSRIQRHQPKHAVQPAKHDLRSSRPRCDLHWRFVCSVCGLAKHFNGVGFCDRSEKFLCLGCAKGSRAVRRDFWAWSYYYELKCPWHSEWHRALDWLEYSGKHPWLMNPAWRRDKLGMSRSEEVAGFWSFRVEPAEMLSSVEVGKGWDKAASWWISRYTSRGDLNREWVIDPVLFDWLGDVRGLKVLDAGCGEGYLSRLLADRRAEVVGVDLSDELLGVARNRERSRPLGVRYRKADLADLSVFRTRSFDMVVSNIVLVDVARYREAIGEISRVLKKGGRFLFCITHPAFEGPVPGRWVREPPDSYRIEERRSLAVDRYFDRVAVFWGPPDGKVVVGGFHRPLRDYFEALHNAGFLVSRFEEPTASKEALAKRFYSFADLERIPLFLIIEAVKPE